MSTLEPAEAISAIKAILGITPTPVAPANWDELIAQAASVPAVYKLQLIRAMGFTPGGSDHQWDCMYQFDSGIRCNCVRPATVWTQPTDVDIERGETWEERCNDKRDRRIPDCERP